MFGVTLKTKQQWANKVVMSCRITNTLFLWFLKDCVKNVKMCRNVDFCRV